MQGRGSGGPAFPLIFRPKSFFFWDRPPLLFKGLNYRPSPHPPPPPFPPYLKVWIRNCNKNHFEILSLPSLSYSFGIETTNTFIHSSSLHIKIDSLYLSPILSTVKVIPKYRIPDATSKDFVDSGFHKQKFPGLLNHYFLTWGEDIFSNRNGS